MLKNILHSVLFIALVVIVAYLFATYAPGLGLGLTTDCNHDTSEYTRSLKKLVEKNELLTTRLDALQAQIGELEDALAGLAIERAEEKTQQPTVTGTDHSFVLLQALNSKLAASPGNSRRLLLELAELETLIAKLPNSEDTATLLREVYLARTETAAGINSAAERLEIIWTLLLSHLSS